MQPFEITFAQLRGGSASREASDGIQRIVDAVLTTGRAGKLVIEITIKPNSKNRGTIEAVKIVDSIKVKLPEEPAESIMFVNAQHELTINNQRQEDLFPEHKAPRRIVDQDGVVQQIS